MLAAFIGFEVIRHVSPLLHTPLMSLTNALDAIAVVGAIVGGESAARELEIDVHANDLRVPVDHLLKWECQIFYVRGLREG